MLHPSLRINRQNRFAASACQFAIKEGRTEREAKARATSQRATILASQCDEPILRSESEKNMKTQSFTNRKLEGAGGNEFDFK